MTIDNTWISVNGFLPPINARVLVVCVNPQNKMERHVSICTFFGKNENGALLWSGHKKVTHWMICPDLPDEVEQKGIPIKDIAKRIKVEITYQDIYDDWRKHYPELVEYFIDYRPALEEYMSIIIWTTNNKYLYSYETKQLRLVSR